MQLTLLKEPTWLIDTEVDVAAWPFALGLQPAQIGMGGHPAIGGNTLETAPHPASDQPLSGEQGHLGVVGDLPQTTVNWCVLGDALRAKATENLGPLHELD